MTDTEHAFDLRKLSILIADPMRAADIAAVHAETFQPAWDVKAVEGLLTHPGSVAFVGQTGVPQRCVGFVMAQLAVDEGEILSIGVVPALEGRGIGRRLVDAVVRASRAAGSRRLFLEVAADNMRAGRLYTGAGFRPVGLRKGYYRRNPGPAVDAVILELRI